MILNSEKKKPSMKSDDFVVNPKKEKDNTLFM